MSAVITAGMTFGDWMQSTQAGVESALDQFLPAADAVPHKLHAAMRYAAAKQVDLGRLAQAGGGKLAGATMSGIEMIETIKASGAENGYFERWAGYYAKQHNAQVAIAKFTHYFGAVPLLLQQIANIAILMRDALHHKRADIIFLDPIMCLAIMLDCLN